MSTAHDLEPFLKETNVQIRDALDTDLEGILQIYNDAVQHTTAIWNETLVDLANRRAWGGLPEDLQAILTEATRAASRDMMDDYVYNNALALDQLKQQGVELKRFPDEVLQAMREQSEVVLESLAAENDLNGRIWASQKAFLEEASAMQMLTEKELYNWR